MNALTSKAQTSSPYRVSRPRPGRQLGADPASLFGSMLLLITSLMRLYRPALGLEEFGAEPTLALLATLLTSAYLLATARAWLARPRAQRAAGEGRSISPDEAAEDTAEPPLAP